MKKVRNSILLTVILLLSAAGVMVKAEDCRRGPEGEGCAPHWAETAGEEESASESNAQAGKDTAILLTETETETGMEPETTTEKEAWIETEIKMESETVPETGTGTEPKTTAEKEAWTETEIEMESETAPETETGTEPKPTTEKEAWIETEIKMESGNTDALPEQTTASTKDVPVSLDDEYVTATWTREWDGPETVYTQGKHDSQIAAIDEGVWKLVLDIYLNPAGKEALRDGLYTCQLIWPAGEAKFSGGSNKGEIVFGGLTGFGSWEISEDGMLTLILDDIGGIAEAYGRISQYISFGEEETGLPGEEPVMPGIRKEGVYDASLQKVFWTVTAIIPAWDGSKTYTWCIEDEEQATPFLAEDIFKNDYAGMTVTRKAKKAGMGTVIPEVTDVEEDSELAYYCETESSGKTVIWFLNPCTCGSDPCQRERGICENIKYTDLYGTVWCSCWHGKRNSEFELSYDGETAMVEQQIQENGQPEAHLTNEVDLLENGMVAGNSIAKVTLHQAIKKTETEFPDAGNDYSSSYTITVNPSHDDYSRAEYILITDVMENLSYLSGSMQIVYQNEDLSSGELKEIGEEQAAAIGREGNENCFYSIAGEDTQTIVIKIWYPSQAAYTLSYRAEVADLKEDGVTEYQNTAYLGDVSSTARGKGFQVSDEWLAASYEAVIWKTDASSDSDPVGLSGAIFRVCQYQEEGEDTLIATLTTGEDGKALFRTNRDEGILISRNTLYYMQEMEAPEGYELDDTRHYFYFSPADDMILPGQITAEKGEKQEGGRVPTYTVTLSAPNVPIQTKERELPGTGGPGEALLLGIGLFFVLTSGKAFRSGRRTQ